MSKIALRLATITLGIMAFATVPALAAHKSKAAQKSATTASAPAPQYQKVERWDHGKKYTDYMGGPPPAPTQQDLANKRADAAQRNSLRAATRWDHGKQIYDYSGTMPAAPTPEDLTRRQQDAAQAHHLRSVTRMEYGKKVTDYMSQ
jgi:hypothetical protein